MYKIWNKSMPGHVDIYSTQTIIILLIIILLIIINNNNKTQQS